jgi:hypothetical protein
MTSERQTSVLSEFNIRILTSFYNKIMRTTSVATVFLASLLPFSTIAQCASTASQVGQSGVFTRNIDGLVGSITIVDDCSFTAQISIAAGVPAIYWYPLYPLTSSGGGRLALLIQVVCVSVKLKSPSTDYKTLS